MLSEFSRHQSFIGFFQAVRKPVTDLDCFRMVFIDGSKEHGYCYLNFMYAGLFIVDEEDEFQVAPKEQLRFVKELELLVEVKFDLIKWESNDWTPIMVVHRHFFDERFIIYREGMCGIYQINKSDVGEISPVQFPLNFSFIHGFTGNASLLLTKRFESINYLDVEHSAFKFRDAIARGFVAAIKACATPNNQKFSISFSIHCEPHQAHRLFSSPVLEHLVHSESNPGNLVTVLYDSALQSFRVPRRLTTIQVPRVDLLHDFLGYRFSFLPLSVKNFVRGDFIAEIMKYVGVPKRNSCIVFNFDHVSNTLTISAPILRGVSLDQVHFDSVKEQELVDDATRSFIGKVLFDKAMKKHVIVVLIEDNITDFVVRGTDKRKRALFEASIVVWVRMFDDVDFEIDPHLADRCCTDKDERKVHLLAKDLIDIDWEQEVINFPRSARKRQSKPDDEIPAAPTLSPTNWRPNHRRNWQVTDGSNEAALIHSLQAIVPFHKEGLFPEGKNVSAIVKGLLVCMTKALAVDNTNRCVEADFRDHLLRSFQPYSSAYTKTDICSAMTVVVPTFEGDLDAIRVRTYADFLPQIVDAFIMYLIDTEFEVKVASEI